jgi:hypothetical protein
VRPSPLSISIQGRNGTPWVRANAATALAVSMLSRKKLKRGASRISSAARGSLSGVMHTAY